MTRDDADDESECVRQYAIYLQFSMQPRMSTSAIATGSGTGAADVNKARQAIVKTMMVRENIFECK